MALLLFGDGDDDATNALLTYACELVGSGHDRAAVQLIMKCTDDWMHAQQLDLCSDMLQKANPVWLGVTVSLGLLTALDPVRNKTRKARDEFIACLRTHLLDTRPDDAEELMRGIR